MLEIRYTVPDETPKHLLLPADVQAGVQAESFFQRLLLRTKYFPIPPHKDAGGQAAKWTIVDGMWVSEKLSSSFTSADELYRWFSEVKRRMTQSTTYHYRDGKWFDEGTDDIWLEVDPRFLKPFRICSMNKFEHRYVYSWQEAETIITSVRAECNKPREIKRYLTLDGLWAYDALSNLDAFVLETKFPHQPAEYIIHWPSGRKTRVKDLAAAREVILAHRLLSATASAEDKTRKDKLKQSLDAFAKSLSTGTIRIYQGTPPAKPEEPKKQNKYFRLSYNTEEPGGGVWLPCSAEAHVDYLLLEQPDGRLYLLSGMKQLPLNVPYLLVTSEDVAREILWSLRRQAR